MLLIISVPCKYITMKSWLISRDVLITNRVFFTCVTSSLKNFNERKKKNMDIDIEDILSELDRDTTVVEYSDPGHFTNSDGTTAVASSSFQHNLPSSAPRKKIRDGGYSDDYIISPEEDYRRLITHWRNERCAPELLPYPHLLISRILRQIQEQMERLELMSMYLMDMQAAENEDTEKRGSDEVNDYRHRHDTSSHPHNNNNMLPLLCMEAELERVKFVLRSYLRCRLAKIDKYSLYLLQLKEHTQRRNGVRILPLEELLSKEELDYHQRHFGILLKLLNQSILKHMPTELQAINDTEGSVSMIDEPDWNKFVFIRVKGPALGALEADPQLSKDETGKYFYSVTIPDLNEDVELTIGSIYVMRYSVIRDLLQEDKVELI